MFSVLFLHTILHIKVVWMTAAILISPLAVQCTKISQISLIARVGERALPEKELISDSWSRRVNKRAI